MAWHSVRARTGLRRTDTRRAYACMRRAQGTLGGAGVQGGGATRGVPLRRRKQVLGWKPKDAQVRRRLYVGFVKPARRSEVGNRRARDVLLLSCLPRAHTPACRRCCFPARCCSCCTVLCCSCSAALHAATATALRADAVGRRRQSWPMVVVGRRL